MADHQSFIPSAGAAPVRDRTFGLLDERNQGPSYASRTKCLFPADLLCTGRTSSFSAHYPTGRHPLRVFGARILTGSSLGHRWERYSQPCFERSEATPRNGNLSGLYSVGGCFSGA